MTIKTDILSLILVILVIYLFYHIFDKKIFPKLVDRHTKEIEKNPKWITSRLQYYGFDDIDFILARSVFGMIPRLRVNKKKDRLELLLPEEISVDDIEEIGRIALACKIQARYGVLFADKPLYWLSILCYMLDGGDVKMEPKSVIDKKPIDDCQKL